MASNTSFLYLISSGKIQTICKFSFSHIYFSNHTDPCFVHYNRAHNRFQILHYPNPKTVRKKNLSKFVLFCDAQTLFPVYNSEQAFILTERKSK